jgi:hypothetical protein
LCKKEQETDEHAREPSMRTIPGTSEKKPYMWRQKNDIVNIDELVGYVIVDIGWRASNNHLSRKGERVRKQFLKKTFRAGDCISLPKLDSSKTKVIMLQNPLLP